MSTVSQACLVALLLGGSSCGESGDPLDANGGDDAARADDASRDADVDPADDGSEIEPNLDWRPLSPNAKYEGKTLDELALDWARWNLSKHDCIDNPENDLDGALCTLDQSGGAPVFFVASGEYPTVRTRCTVRSEQAILIPLIYFYADGVSHPFGVNTPAEGLVSEAESIQRTMRDMTLIVDGMPIDGFEEFQVGPIKFAQTLPRSDNYYTCGGIAGVAGPLDPIYLVGYFALLPPPSPGKHRIEFGGTYSYVGWDYVNEVSFTFTAE